MDRINVQEQINTLDKQDFPAANVDNIQKEWHSATAAMQDFYEKMIFIAGLNVDVRVKVMEATPKFAYDALKIARTTEMLILDKKDNLKMPIKIMAVEAEAEREEEEPEEYEDDAVWCGSQHNSNPERKGTFQEVPRELSVVADKVSQWSSTQEWKWRAHEVQILQEVRTHAEGMLKTEQWSQHKASSTKPMK